MDVIGLIPQTLKLFYTDLTSTNGYYIEVGSVLGLLTVLDPSMSWCSY